MLQPLVVVPNGRPDHYRILAGHRRHAAAQAAGVEVVPCIVRHDLTEEADQIAAMLVENTQREDLTAVEEARGVQELLDLGDSVKVVAGRTGMSETKIRQRVKVAKLPDDLSRKLTRHQLSLADAVFIADHADEPEDLATLERDLGTVNWAAAKETVLGRVAERKVIAKFRTELEADGWRYLPSQEWHEERERIAERLGVYWYSLIDDRYTWPLSAADEIGVRGVDRENAFGTKRSGWDAGGRTWRDEYLLVVYRAPEPKPEPKPTTPDDDGAEPSATDSPATDAPAPGVEPASDDPPAISAEEIERREMQDAAGRVRQAFALDIIREGDSDKALAAVKVAAHLDSIEVAALGHSWWEVLEGVLAEDAEDMGPAEWIQAQSKPGSVLLAYAWTALVTADDALDEVPSVDRFDIYDAELIAPYTRLLQSWGYELSTVEQELADEAWRRIDAKPVYGDE